jgi:hypothetical protein
MSPAPADRDLTGGNAALPAHSPPAAELFAIILMFGPRLGRSLQPRRVARRRGLRRDAVGDAIAYAPAQIIGCILGAVAANVMFSQAVVSISTSTVPPARTCSQR